MSHTDQEEKTLSQTVREFIKEKRLAKGMSQKELAIALFQQSQYQGYISSIENGTRELTVNSLERILKVLDAEVLINEL